MLQKLHEQEIERIVSKHKSEMEEMKRQYTLQRDRENAAHEEELQRIREQVRDRSNDKPGCVDKGLRSLTRYLFVCVTEFWRRRITSGKRKSFYSLFFMHQGI